MKKETFSIISEYDALPIAGTVFTPDGFIKGVLQFSHGMCENRLRYEGVMEFFAQNGYACVIHDHRGHGESVLSSEDFGYFKDTSGTAIVNDLYRVIFPWQAFNASGAQHGFPCSTQIYSGTRHKY